MPREKLTDTQRRRVWRLERIRRRCRDKVDAIFDAAGISRSERMRQKHRANIREALG